MRLLRDHITTLRRCLFVVPGPSAEHALGMLPFGHIATVNRAALIVPGPIDLACCNDIEAIEAIRPAWDRVRTFIVPDQLGIGGRVENKSWAEFPDAPHERALIFPHRPLTASPDEVDVAIDDPQRLPTCNSACAGLCAVARLGYQQVQVLGCDGGKRYASILCHGVDYEDYDVIRDRMHQIGRRVGESSGCEVRFWPDRF